jgi:hypothetical protein
MIEPAGELAARVEAMRLSPTLPRTVGERILDHLRAQPLEELREQFDAWPPEATQDGIAAALDLTRAHVALELKRLMAKGDVEQLIAHVTGGKNRRRVYRIVASPFRIYNGGGHQLPIVKGEARTIRVVEFACPRCGSQAKVAFQED